MLRFALIVLLLANAGYLAWTQGWMDTLGWTPNTQSEPYRLQQQIRPEVLSIAPPTPVPTPALTVAETLPANARVTAAPAPTEPAEEMLPEATVCLQSENMTEAQHRKLQEALRRSELPSDSWEFTTTPVSGRWMVYLGKFPNEMSMEKRRAELRARKIAYDRAGGNLDPGLSLGRFSTEEAATRELGNLLNQGIRGARVVQERAPQTLYALRLSQATAAQRTLLQRLQPALDGKAIRPCP